MSKSERSKGESETTQSGASPLPVAHSCNRTSLAVELPKGLVLTTPCSLLAAPCKTTRSSRLDCPARDSSRLVLLLAKLYTLKYKELHKVRRTPLVDPPANMGHGNSDRLYITHVSPPHARSVKSTD